LEWLGVAVGKTTQEAHGMMPTHFANRSDGCQNPRQL